MRSDFREDRGAGRADAGLSAGREGHEQQPCQEAPLHMPPPPLLPLPQPAAIATNPSNANPMPASKLSLLVLLTFVSWH